MQRTLLRLVAGLFAILAGVIWVSVALLAGGNLLEHVQGQNFGYFEAGFAFFVLMFSLAITALFALGIVRFRYGPHSPRVFWVCIVIGSATLLGALTLMGRRVG